MPRQGPEVRATLAERFQLQYHPTNSKCKVVQNRIYWETVVLLTPKVLGAERFLQGRLGVLEGPSEVPQKSSGLYLWLLTLINAVR